MAQLRRHSKLNGHILKLCLRYIECIVDSLSYLKYDASNKISQLTAQGQSCFVFNAILLSEKLI